MPRVTGGARLDPMFRRLWLHVSFPVYGAAVVVVVESSVFFVRMRSNEYVNLDPLCMDIIACCLCMHIVICVVRYFMHLGRVRYIDNSSITNASNSRFICSTG